MNHGCLTTILKPKGKVRNGTRKVLLVWRKQAWADPGWKPWLLFFSDSRGIVHKEFVPPGETVNHAFHTALSIREFLAKKNIPVLPNPSYSPDLAPRDFYLFSKLKSKLKGHRFGTMENIQNIVTDELNTLTENDFQYCYDQWKKRWNHCVTSQMSYFEGDNL